MAAEDDLYLIDVIVPLYKVDPDFITTCLNSIKNQTMVSWRCYIIDGTPDNWSGWQAMQDAINPFLTDFRFRYDVQTGTGVSQARNQAIEVGNSDFVAFLDGDDYWLPAHLSELYDAIEPSDESTVLWFTAVESQISIQSQKTGEVYTKVGVLNNWRDFYRLDPVDSYWYLRSRPVITSAVCVRRSRMDDIDGFDTTMDCGEDVDYWLRLVKPNFAAQQLDVISVGRVNGTHQTTQFGPQSSAYDKHGGDPAAIKQAYLDQMDNNYLTTHPDPTDADRRPEMDDDYWDWLTYSKGSLPLLLLGNAISADVASDSRSELR